MKRCLLCGLLGCLAFLLTACSSPKDENPVPSDSTTEEVAAPAPHDEGDATDVEKLSPEQLEALKKDLAPQAADPSKPVELPKDLPEILNKAMEIPAEPTPENLVTILTIFDSTEGQKALQESMAKLQSLPQEQAMAVVEKVRNTQSAAAEALLASKDATETQKRAAVDVKVMEIFSAEQEPNEKLKALQDQFAKDGMNVLAWDVEFFLLQNESPRQNPTPEAVATYVDKLIAFLKPVAGKDQITRMQMGALMGFVSSLEGMVDTAKIAELAETLAAALEGSTNETLAKARTPVLGMAKRLGLVGKPMEFAGVTLDGKPVNIQDYAGKVVLIDFWATWCGPCVATLPSLRTTYEKYQAKGFEVLAFSLDEERDVLEKFVKDEKLPWTVVVKSEDQAVANPADTYGVFAIPTMILIGKDGNVLSVNARDNLNKTLEELFPLTEEEKAAAEKALEALQLPDLTEEAPAEEAPVEVPAEVPAPAPAEEKPAEVPAEVPAEEVPAPAPAEEAPAEEVAPSESTSEESDEEADVEVVEANEEVDEDDAPVPVEEDVEEEKPVEIPEVLKKAMTPPAADATLEALLAYHETLGIPEAETEAAGQALQALPEKEGMEVLETIAKNRQAVSLAIFQHKDASELQKRAVLEEALPQLLGETEDVPASLAKWQADFEKQGWNLLAWDLKFLNRIITFQQSLGNTSQDKIAAALGTFFEDLAQLLGSVKGKNYLSLEQVQMVLNFASLAKRMEGLDKSAKTLLQATDDVLDGVQDEAIQEIRNQLQVTLRRLNLVGSTMDVAGKTLDGKALSLKDYAGKVVLVDFWATWCGPCVGEIPRIQELYKRYHAKGFEVLAFSVDTDREALEKFLKEEKLPWTTIQKSDEANAVDPSEYYGIDSIPAMFLIGQDGKVLTLNAREELETWLEKLLPLTEEEKKTIEKEYEADQKALEEELQKVNLPDVESESTSETTEASESDTAELRKKIEEAFALPEEATLENLTAYLTYNPMITELQKLPEEDALRFSQQLQQCRIWAAEKILADPKATPEALHLAADAMVNTLMFQALTEKKDPAPGIQKLVATLEARQAFDVALLVEAGQLLNGVFNKQRMLTPAENNELLGQITVLSQKAKERKCISGEVMATFLRMIMNTEGDAGAAETDAACTALREAMLASDDANIAGSADTLTGMARRLTLPGKPMELVGADMEGNEVNLAQFKGKVVLVDFWATWCTPCIRELANLRSVYEKYHERGFEILAFSIDRDMDKLKAFLAEKQMPWPVAAHKLDDARPIADPTGYYGVLGIPCMILVDANGNVVTTNARGDRLLQALDKLFPEK